MELRAGEIIGGKYRVERELGRGGMGAVYVATDLRLERSVALKVLEAALEDRQEAQARFRREAIVASRVRHPNVIEIYDADIDGGVPWIAMELLEGESLDALLQRRSALAPGEVVWIAREVLGALEEIHAEGIVHRDLKPGNVFLERRRAGLRLKVLDFGIARGTGGTLTPITQVGRTLGTPWYMPPEQILGQDELDGRADLFALGVILFEALAGAWPWNGERYEQVIGQILSFDAPPVTKLRPDAPPTLAEIVARACARPRDERFGSATEMRRALSESGVGATPIELRPEELTSAEALRDVPRTRSSHTPPLERTEPITAGASPGQPPPGSAARTTHPAAGGTTPFGVSSRPAPAAERGFLGLLVLAAAVGAAATAGALWVVLRSSEPTAPSLTPPGSDGGPVDELARADASLPEAALGNAWVRVEPPRRGALLLGLPGEESDEHVEGFRPSRGVLAPSEAFEMQRHEVTWAELDPWLAASGRALERPAIVPSSPEERASLPATGVPWSIAHEYCASLGGALPTEAQWEYAARGEELRAQPWGADAIDVARTHAFAGREGAPIAVMTSPQDRTPGGEDRALYDMLGNAQEWTADLWRSSGTGGDNSWVEGGGRQFRAVRGLPLLADPPPTLPRQGAAYRMPLCATERCPPSLFLSAVGFRCARDT